MNVEIGTQAPLFLFWEYLFQIFGILSLQCIISSMTAMFWHSPKRKRHYVYLGLHHVNCCYGNMKIYEKRVKCLTLYNWRIFRQNKDQQIPIPALYI